MNLLTIADIMLKDHKKIIDLLINFERKIDKDIKTTMKAFDKFEWNLEKHIFVEEKVIFLSFEQEYESESYDMIPKLMKDHNEILNQLKSIKKSIKKQKSIDFQEFKEILINHKNFENEKVYPQFDQELNKSSKKVIINRINEIKLTDSG